MAYMKEIRKNLCLLIIFISTSSIGNNHFDNYRTDGINHKKWSSLKSATQEIILLPSGVSFDATNSSFGWSVSVDGDRALIGGPVISIADGIRWYDMESRCRITT